MHVSSYVCNTPLQHQQNPQADTLYEIHNNSFRAAHGVLSTLIRANDMKALYANAQPPQGTGADVYQASVMRLANIVQQCTTEIGALDADLAIMQQSATNASNNAQIRMRNLRLLCGPFVGWQPPAFPAVPAGPAAQLAAMNQGQAAPQGAQQPINLNVGVPLRQQMIPQTAQQMSLQEVNEEFVSIRTEFDNFAGEIRNAQAKLTPALASLGRAQTRKAHGDVDLMYFSRLLDQQVWPGCQQFCNIPTTYNVPDLAIIYKETLPSPWEVPVFYFEILGSKDEWGLNESFSKLAHETCEALAFLPVVYCVDLDETDMRYYRFERDPTEGIIRISYDTVSMTGMGGESIAAAVKKFHNYAIKTMLNIHEN